MSTNESGHAIDKGKERESNEDSVAAVDLNVATGDDEKSVSVYAVADGVGGVADGEVASSAAISTAVQEIVSRITSAKSEVNPEYQQWLEQSLHTANNVVRGNRDKKDRIGTTLVVALVIDKEAYIANVGDSRAYLLVGEDIYQITEDQSVVQMLINAGAITEEDAENHPYRNVLSQAVGMDTNIDVDTFQQELEKDAYLLLCSDGLTNELNNEQLQSIVLNSDSPQGACDELVKAANEAGGKDNISIVLVKMV